MANLRNFNGTNVVLEGTGVALIQDGSRISFQKGLMSSDIMNVSYWTQGDVDELNACIYAYKQEHDLNGLWNVLKHYDASYTDVSDEYAKDSYRDGKDRMIAIIETAFKGCSYSQEYLKTLESFNFDCTSAILYKGVYVTPSMVRVCIDYVLDKMSKDQKQDLYLLTGLTPKELIEEATSKIAIGETPTSLEMIDLVRGI